MTERPATNKTARLFAKPLRDLAGKVVGETFRRQGFASVELVTRWAEIAGEEVSACSEPMKIQWPRIPSSSGGEANCGLSLAGGRQSGRRQPAGTLVLRVEGPAAIEIQHLAGVICERVNRFLGWRAVERIALRQAPLRRAARKATAATDPAAVARVAASLSDIADNDLRQALARLGAAVGRG